MNRIIFVFCVLALSIWVAIWSTLYVLNTDTSLSKAQNTLPELIQQISPVTVSITGTLADGSMTTTRTGTGIIVRSDGIILTNKHLIGEWFVYSIELNDGTQISAKLVKTHPSLDLALLSLMPDMPPPSLPVWIFINSQAHVRQGDRVVTLGNTLGLYPWSASEGIISGLNRSVSFSGIIMDWLIQTSIPMTLGNSGGPLVNEEGKIIGINIGIVGWSSQIGWTLPLTQESIETFLK